MEDNEIDIGPDEARTLAAHATDSELFDILIKAYGEYARLCSERLYRTRPHRCSAMQDNSYVYFPYCSLYMTKEQLALTEAQKQLAENQTQLAEQQTKIAERQEEIAKRIEQGSDRTMRLTKRITCLTYVLVAVGIITLVAVCVQIALQIQWI